MLIAMKSQLELTDDQVKKLDALRNAPHQKPNEAELLRARADMVEAMQGDGDLTKARAALDKMNRLRTDEQIARLKERQDVRNVLTATQKTKLDNMRGMMRQRMRGGMKAQMKARMKGMRGGRAMGPGMQGGPGMRMRMRPGMGEGQGFAPGGRRGGMGAPGGGMGPGMAPGMMGPGMGPGVGPGDTGPNGPGRMRPAMGRRGEGMEPDVNVDKRPPVPPSDSLSIR